MRLLFSCLLLVGCGGAVAPDPGGGDAGSENTAPRPLRPACPETPLAPGDFAPKPGELLAAAEFVTAVAVDDEEVFFASTPGAFVSGGGGSIEAVNKRTGARRRVAEGGAFMLAVDAEWLYRGTSRIHKKSGAVEEYMYGSDFALGGDWVFRTSLDGKIFREPKSGGALAELAGGLGAPQGPSTYGGYLYFVQYTRDSIERIPFDGGSPEVLASGWSEHFPRSTKADCYDLYYSIGNYGDSIRRVSLSDRRVETVASEGGAIAIDQASLFVVGRRALRISRASGARTDLGPGRDLPAATPLHTAVVVDDEALYWSSSAGVMRAQK